MPNLGRPRNTVTLMGRDILQKLGIQNFAMCNIAKHCKMGIPKIPTPMHKIRKV